jgi:hypothetical protein
MRLVAAAAKGSCRKERGKRKRDCRPILPGPRDCETRVDHQLIGWRRAKGTNVLAGADVQYASVLLLYLTWDCYRRVLITSE